MNTRTPGMSNVGALKTVVAGTQTLHASTAAEKSVAERR